MNENTRYKARYKTGSTSEFQPLAQHLRETGAYAALFAGASGLSQAALLLGLVHDLGKGSDCWASYLEENKGGVLR